MAHDKDATSHLLQAVQGDERAADQLMPMIYNELRALAESYVRKQPAEFTLQPTALVHEAYLRLIDLGKVGDVEQAHFSAIAATVMRNVLVDRARSRRAAKRGGRHQQVPLDEAVEQFQAQSGDLLALDDALKELANEDPILVKIVESRFFGGMTVLEVSDALQVPKRSVERQWRYAKARLHSLMQEKGAFHAL